jgi:hypothetical protein
MKKYVKSLDEFINEAKLNEEWIIICKVSGGVTGTRESILKSKGEIKTFGTKAEAEKEAHELNDEMNKGVGSARYHYYAELNESKLNELTINDIKVGSSLKTRKELGGKAIKVQELLYKKDKSNKDVLNSVITDQGTINVADIDGIEDTNESASTLSLDSIVDDVYKEVKGKNNWPRLAYEKIKNYTKDRSTINQILDILHDEDHFDDEIGIEDED